MVIVVGNLTITIVNLIEAEQREKASIASLGMFGTSSVSL